MSDALPRITLGLDDDGAPEVLVGEDRRAADLAGLLALVPGLAAPGAAAMLARAANHLAHGTEYEVITDPAAFEADFRARLAREDPAEPWREGVIRLCDYGVPDFAAIRPPALAGGVLSFHVVDGYLGLPYAARIPLAGGAPDYVPMPLVPVTPAFSRVPAAPPGEAGETGPAETLPDAEAEVAGPPPG